MRDMNKNKVVFVSESRPDPLDAYEIERTRVLTDCAVISDDDPHRTQPWLIQGVYGAVAVVWASCEQDALDEAADHDLLKCFAVDEEEKITTNESGEDFDENGAHVTRLGNCGEPFVLDHCMLTPLLPLWKQPVKTAIAVAFAVGSCQGRLDPA